MICTITGHKIFLVTCNIGLMFTGLMVLVLGVKMKELILMITLDKIFSFSSLLRAVNLIIATGIFIAITGGTGCSGACYEVFWMMGIHVGGLGLIITMELGIGITLLAIKNTVEDFMNSEDCVGVCRLTLDTMIVNFATPAVATTFSIIILQVLMLYSGVTLFFYFRDTCKQIFQPTVPVIIQTTQMQNVASPNVSALYPHPPSEQGPPYQQDTVYCPQSGYATYRANPQLRHPLPTNQQGSQGVNDKCPPPSYSEMEQKTSPHASSITIFSPKDECGIESIATPVASDAVQITRVRSQSSRMSLKQS